MSVNTTQWSMISRLDGEIVDGPKAISANCTRALYHGPYWFGNLDGAQGEDALRMLDKLNCFDEMYEALKCFVDNWSAELGASYPHYEDVAKAERALKKARGES